MANEKSTVRLATRHGYAFNPSIPEVGTIRSTGTDVPSSLVDKVLSAAKASKVMVTEVKNKKAEV